jgi:hypothetical protein
MWPCGVTMWRDPTTLGVGLWARGGSSAGASADAIGVMGVPTRCRGHLSRPLLEGLGLREVSPALASCSPSSPQAMNPELPASSDPSIAPLAPPCPPATPSVRTLCCSGVRAQVPRHPAWGLCSRAHEALPPQLKTLHRPAPQIPTSCSQPITLHHPHIPKPEPVPALKGHPRANAPLPAGTCPPPSTRPAVARLRQAVLALTRQQVVFRLTAWDGAAMTARRWVALVARRGDDDMFSCDLTDPELQVLREEEVGCRVEALKDPEGGWRG